MSNDKIIARMKKLLAMSEGKANENEAMVAAKQLHAMLSKYNISLSELSNDESDNDIGEEGLEIRDRPWKRIVGMKIAELYFCSFYYVPSRRNPKSTFMFIGTEANRMFAIHILKMIVRTVEREGHAQCKAYCGKTTGPFYNSFLTGASRRILHRCDLLIESAKAGTLEDEDGKMLPALLSVYDLNQLNIDGWKESNCKGLRKSNTKTRVTNSLGLAKGKEVGDRVQLSRTLQSNSSPKLIGRN